MSSRRSVQLVVDPTELALTSGATPGLPAMDEAPLIIQDRSWVWGAPALGTGTFQVRPGLGNPGVRGVTRGTVRAGTGTGRNSRGRQPQPRFQVFRRCLSGRS
jgi:hypothetical protein